MTKISAKKLQKYSRKKTRPISKETLHKKIVGVVRGQAEQKYIKNDEVNNWLTRTTGANTNLCLVGTNADLIIDTTRMRIAEGTASN